jgi:phosphocarrier protein HPr
VEATSVALHVKGRHANARSIVAVMLLAADMGSTVRLETSGVDEQEAMAALTSLIRDGFRDSSSLT